MLIVGIIVVTHNIPNEGCVGEKLDGVGGSSTHKDVTKLAQIAGGAALGASAIGLIGGFLGCCGGIHQFHRMYANGGPKRQKCCIVSSSVMVFLAILLTIVVHVCIATGWKKASDICFWAECGSNGLCNMDCITKRIVPDLQKQNEFTDTKTCATSYCKADFDAFCDNPPISISGLVITVVADILLLIAMCFSCAAGVCCPAKFELAVAPAPKDVEAKAES